jgi:hypothetical protein
VVRGDVRCWVGGNRYDGEVYMLISNRSKAGVDSGVDSGPLSLHHDLHIERTLLRHNVLKPQ